ncbi:hypothetical protein AAL_07063 [Moelleriella libera RCEF 2490]|uniref:Uncharacterized protein n=1 Tax=Moelleriella libera RCEF 2490 TaxID=1081109 RepID=A0A167Y447_9HYPO|nr:hypothetical protein AAL_07063 [Moelleriella libera RCEF 2490]
MKTFTALSIALLAATQGASAQSSAAVSTVVCSACVPVSSTPDIVTRSPVPTTPCTAPSLITVAATGGAVPGANSTASLPPPVAAANAMTMFAGATGLFAFAIGAALFA